MFENLTPPTNGASIAMGDGGLSVPDRPILPFIEGDGTGPDIWRASVKVFDAAGEKVEPGPTTFRFIVPTGVGPGGTINTTVATPTSAFSAIFSMLTP